MHKDNSHAWYGKGYIFLINRDLQNAEICFNKAIEINKNKTSYDYITNEHIKQTMMFSLQGKSLVAFLQQNYELSDILFNEAFSSCSAMRSQVKFHLLSGLVFRHLKIWNKAYMSFENVSKLRPGSILASQNLNALDTEIAPFLFQWVMESQYDKAIELINIRANLLNVTEQSTGHSLLHALLCLKEMNRAFFNKILDSDFDLNRVNLDGNTALIIAVLNKHHQTIKLLLQQSCEIDTQNNFGNSALHIAALQNDLVAFQLLLESRANINLLNADHLKVFDIATTHQHNEMMAILLAQNPQLNNLNLSEVNQDYLRFFELKQACKDGDINKINSIIIEDENILNYQGLAGQSSIMFAAEAGRIDVLEYLFKKGANINLVNNRDETAIEITVSKQYWKCLIFLLKFRQKITIEDVKKQLNYCNDNYNDAYETWQLKNKNLIDTIVRGLTGVDVAEVMQNDKWIFMGHLHSLKGHIISSSNRNRADNLEGIDLDKCLALRIRYHFEILLKLKRNLITHLPLGMTKNRVINGLIEEITTNIETLRAYKDACLVIGFLDQPYKDQAIKAHAANIANKIENLTEGGEYSYRSGFEGNPGHYLYVGFSRKNNQIIIRVDNLGDGRQGKHQESEKMSKNNITRPAVKPCFIGQVPVYQFAENRKVLEYIQNIIEAQFTLKTDALPKIYKKLSDNVLIDTGPAKRPQIVGNCGLKNHSAGMHNRLNRVDGNGFFYKWLIQKESEATATKVQASSSLPTQVMSGNNGSHVRLPPQGAACEEEKTFELNKEELQEINFVHQELMRRLASGLNVDDQDIFSGTIVEQILVQMSDIQTEQTGALFRTLDQNTTIFRLKLRSQEEIIKFIKYYDEHFPHLIKSRSNIEYQEDKLTTISLDSSIFRSQVLQTICKYHQESLDMNSERSLTKRATVREEQNNNKKSCIIM